jgi:hypothetical protein
MPQNSLKNCFLIVSDYFSYKNRPIDLVRGLFSSLDIGTYIQYTCEPLCTFLGPIGDAQMPQNSINTRFLAALDHFSFKNRPIDLVRCPLSNLDTGTYIWPTCRSVCTFLGPFGRAQMLQNSRKNSFLVVADHFLYKNWPIYLVRGLFSSFNNGTYIPLTCGLLSTFLGPFGGAQMPQNSTKNLFFGWSGPLILQEQA